MSQIGVFSILSGARLLDDNDEEEARGRNKSPRWRSARRLLFLEIKISSAPLNNRKPSQSAVVMTEHYLPFTFATLNAELEN